MKKTCTFIYEEMTDRLFISCKHDSDKMYGSVRLLNVILDVTTKNELVIIPLLESDKKII